MNHKHLFMLCAVALCNPLSLLAQKQGNDSIDGYRFVYEYTYPGRKSKLNDRQALDIDPKAGTSVFYSENNANKQKMINSTKVSGTADLGVLLSQINAMPKGASWVVYKNLPKAGMLTYTDRMGKDFKYTDDMPAIKWTVSSDRKELCGYPCQKAEAEFLGRHWTAWYTTEVPLSDGPWKLCGLPGMILEASDADTLFHFTCIGMESVRLAPIAIPDKKYLKCTHDEMEREYRKKNEDRVAYLRNMFGEDTKIYDKNGKERTTMKVDVPYIERREGDKQ